MKTIENISTDEERAFYGSHGLMLKNVRFDGPSDGESALKECSDVTAENCFCNLRYPFWHDKGLKIKNCNMTELCRAAIWYSEHISISGTSMHGIKALRECSDVVIDGSDIVSPEFGWSVKGINMTDCTAVSEYFMLRSSDILMKNVYFRGKYSFQYIKNAVFENCTFDTKDAFWHGENILLKNCTVNGEYLAWYSDEITMVNCKISGTQPFCYCRNLKLVSCSMTNTDLCFEKSGVEADITTPVISIKNPASGFISVPSVCEIIRDDENSTAEIFIKQG